MRSSSVKRLPLLHVTQLTLISLLVQFQFNLTCFAAGNEAELGERVSIYRLIANPEPYTGKVVFVTGYVRIGFEDWSICPSKSTLSTQDCLWLVIDDGPFESEQDQQRLRLAQMKWKHFNRKVVSLRATFDASETGHLGGWSGGLKRITTVAPQL